MSDDEYYMDSPFDEFEEMLWDADPAPHLADDLAQHAAYSPVWQDNPGGGDLEQYHSDWEYYSDDYYDDDPAILKLHPVDGTLPQTDPPRQNRLNRGRKRKLDETVDAAESAESKTLRNSIQGTVWAKDVSPEVEIFKSGQHEKVALLTDWRKRFQLDSHKSGANSNREIKRDESWANDLSLSDMGLTGVRENETNPLMTSVGEDTDIEEAEDGASLLAEDDESASQVEHVSADSVPPHLSEKNVNTSPKRKQQSMGQLDILQHPSNRSPSETQVIHEQIEGTSNLRKKQKVSHLPALLPSLTPSSRVNLEAVPDIQMKGRDKKPWKQQDTSTKNTDVSGPLNAIQQRSKRKLSPVTDETSDAAASTASSRAKRVASAKLMEKSSLSIIAEPPASDTRAARTRKS